MKSTPTTSSRPTAFLFVFVLAGAITYTGLTVLSPTVVSSLHGQLGSTLDMRIVVDQDLIPGHRVYKDTHRYDLMDFVRVDGNDAVVSKVDPPPNPAAAATSVAATADGGGADDGHPAPIGGNAATAFALANLGADMPPAPEGKTDGLAGSGAEMATRVAASCKDRKPGWYLTFNVGDPARLAYGASNQMIAVSNMVNRAMRHNRTLVWPVAHKPPKITKHGAWFLDFLRVRFDLSEFFETFCIITADKMPPKEKQADVLHIHENAAFYEFNSIFDKTGYLVFRGIVFISIFANPREEIKAAVAKFQKDELGPQYVAVHLRELDPYTAPWTGKIKRRSKETADDMREQFFMNPEYVAKKRAEAGLGDAPVFLGTDNRRKNLTEALVARLGAKQFSANGYTMLKDTPETLVFATRAQRQAMDEATVDFMLMMNSSLFLGNDASTVSGNIAAFRRVRGIYTDNVHGPDK